MVSGVYYRRINRTDLFAFPERVPSVDFNFAHWFHGEADEVPLIFRKIQGAAPIPASFWVVPIKKKAPHGPKKDATF
jgi:hypothetical protein